MYIDTHCHLSIEDYDDIDKVIEENRKAGIDKIIISGCTRDTIIESLELISKYPQLAEGLSVVNGALVIDDEQIEKYDKILDVVKAGRVFCIWTGGAG